MKYFFSILILMQLSFPCFGQKNGWIHTNHGTTKRVPIMNANVTSDEYVGHNLIDFLGPALTFSSNVDSVFSVVDGEISVMFFLGDVVAVVIEDSSKTFYTYMALKSSQVIKRQEVKKGEWIGVAMKSEENAMYETKLMISDQNVRSFNGKKMWAMIKR